MPKKSGRVVQTGSGRSWTIGNRFDEYGNVIVARSPESYWFRRPDGSLGEHKRRPKASVDATRRSTYLNPRLFAKSGFTTLNKSWNAWQVHDPAFGTCLADSAIGQGVLHYRMEQILMADNELWRKSLRDCLRHMTSLPQQTLLAYLVLWKLATAAQVYDEHRVEITEEMVAGLDQRKPTIAQLTALNMVVEGVRKPAFGMKILEILEGKSISQAQVDSIRALHAEKGNILKRVHNGVESDKNADADVTDSIHNDDFAATMDKLKSFVLSDDDDIASVSKTYEQQAYGESSKDDDPFADILD